MPKLGDHHSSKLVKLIYIGDSSTGKTGSLTPLVADGYEVNVLDFDNGIDTLKTFVHKECPDKINNVSYITERDKLKAAPNVHYGGQVGPAIVGQPKAFTNGLKWMEKWDDGSDPSQWGEKKIFVLDSLSAFGRAAFYWARALNPTAKDPRQWFHSAQQGVEDVLGLLTSEAFNTNVIVISHVNYVEKADGTPKGYANAIGRALGPIIPRYFNTLVMAESNVVGKTVKRTIKTVPTSMVDLKNPADFKLPGELPLESGMATIFRTLKEA